MSSVKDQFDLLRVADQAISYAADLGLDQAEVALHQGTGVSVTARQQELETVEKHNDAQISVTLYKAHKTGTASSADLSEKGISEVVKAAASIASYTGADDCLGLADAELMATRLDDLDLFHEWQLSVAELADLALQCEQSALQFDTRISNSEGASVSTYDGSAVYANSHGFSNLWRASQHSMSCSVIGADQQGMQRDYWYDSSRNPTCLQSAAEIGRIAADRTVKRLGARKIASTECAVLFDPATAKSLVAHLMNGLRGGAIYKKASFMLDKVEQQILPGFVTISENPHIPGGISSAMHDAEGVATPAYHEIVQGGVPQNYVLGSYTARKLGLQTTANAGGVRNLRVSDTGADFDQMVRQLDTGLLVTELIGSGINMVTGDYSRGAAGFWVAGGEIQYPVEEITIAGNLLDMYQRIVAIGNDRDQRGNTHCGSILLENMTVAGS